MALQKQPININFAQGLDTKTDPNQVGIGKFLNLQNSVFTKAGRLTKRNGFVNTTQLPNAIQTTLTTLNDNLIATGSNLYTYSADTNQWLNEGVVQPVQLSVQSVVRSSTSQESPDCAIASSGLAVIAYMDSGSSYYQVSDSSTGQQILKRTLIANSAINPRCYILGPYFLITFVSIVVSTPTLQYIAIPTANPTAAPYVGTLSASLASQTTGYDAIAANGSLYFAWGASGTSVRIAYMTPSLSISNSVVISSSSATLVSLASDSGTGTLWLSYWDSGSNNAFTAAYSYALGSLMAPTQTLTGVPIKEITSFSNLGVMTLFYEVVNNYTYTDNAGNAIETDYVAKETVTLPASGTGVGTVGAASVVLRSVGLASKPFITAGVIYMLVAYGDVDQVSSLDNSNQPSYFLIDSTGAIYMRLAYSNGGGYAASQVLPNISAINGTYCIPYQITDFLATVNKGTALPAGTPSNAIYTQTGINLAKFTLNTTGQYSSEIAGALHLTGGQLWEFDGVTPVEHGFHVWPENVVATWSATGGAIPAEPPGWVTTVPSYYYQFTYEWTDNAGNLHRSAPSIPVSVLTTGSASTGSITLNVPTLRLTAKLSPNPVRIVGYRWSVAQQVYYQFTSILMPILNTSGTTASWTDGTNTDTSTTGDDSVTIIDTFPDSSILGQTILYTTGGVVEDIAAPASVASCLFNNRLFLIDAEDRNLLWFSKQVIESVPVEMSDLLTLYIAPTTGAQGSTGPMTALGAMDDKIVICKKDAMYYINGTGPDNTGANSTFSDPVFITSSVGCANPSSIVLTPQGLMFQSDKGIWLLGRDLSTNYIGAPVEIYNSQTVKSATAIPGTNQVRFVLDNNITLMYDYFFNQWGTHTNILGISATLYQGSLTYLNSIGQVYQEAIGTYLDGSEPVLMSFTTSWISLSGLQGFERFYFANLLGTYISPFTLNVLLAYDYNSSATQAITVTPDNYAGPWGSEAQWGSGGPWGGSEGNVFSARLFPNKQKCQTFQLTVNEIYDSTLGVPAGQGLTLSGLSLIVGSKKGYRTQSAKKSFG